MNYIKFIKNKNINDLTDKLVEKDLLDYNYILEITEKFNNLDEEGKARLKEKLTNNKNKLIAKKIIYSNENYSFLSLYIQTGSYTKVAELLNTTKQNAHQLINTRIDQLTKELDKLDLEINISKLIEEEKEIKKEYKLPSDTVLIKEIIQERELATKKEISNDYETFTGKTIAEKSLSTLLSRLRSRGDIFAFDNKQFCTKEKIAEELEKIDTAKISDDLKNYLQDSNTKLISIQEAKEILIKEYNHTEIEILEISTYLLKDILLTGDNFKIINKQLSIK